MKAAWARALVGMAMVFAGALTGAEPVATGETPRTGSGETARTGFVDIQELFRRYHKSEEIQKEINLERARIQRQNNAILQQLAELKTGIVAMEWKLGRPSLQGPVAAEERKELEQEIFMRRQEYQVRENQRVQDIENRNRQLDRQMVARMGVLLGEIRSQARKAAEKAGFDYVFDSAGLNTSHVPPVLYAKGATDITPIVLKELNKDAPPGR